MSHQRAVAGWDKGFFDDLVIPLGGVKRDTIPRKDTSLEKLARLPPSFDRTSGKGSLTAGNSSPLTDGAAAIWVASSKGLERLALDDAAGKTGRLGDRLGRFPRRGPADGAGLRHPAPAGAP